MSSPVSSLKRSAKKRNYSTLEELKTQEDNNNVEKASARQQSLNFASWYKHMVDHSRQNIGLYFTEDVVLEWFGRTIKSRKKVAAFLKYDMQCSRHEFTTIESRDRIETRQSRLDRLSVSSQDDNLASPLHSPDITKSKPTSNVLKKPVRNLFGSPRWENEVPHNLPNSNIDKEEASFTQVRHGNDKKRRKHGISDDEDLDLNNQGDSLLGRKAKRKCVQVTPPNCEVGQGDCMPSTSGGSGVDVCHTTLPAPTPRKVVECNGFIEFMRTRNSRSTDSMKWERKCKVQISYSEDPVNFGEFIISAIHYSDESKCRRNLLPAFEEVAQEEWKS